jgi:hypothetical protein
MGSGKEAPGMNARKKETPGSHAGTGRLGWKSIYFEDGAGAGAVAGAVFGQHEAASRAAAAAARAILVMFMVSFRLVVVGLTGPNAVRTDPRG